GAGSVLLHVLSLSRLGAGKQAMTGAFSCFSDLNTLRDRNKGWEGAPPRSGIPSSHRHPSSNIV
ncbi:hypothetical protein SERLADRAFT_398803, partial [Serpula lacrymans var. lacrymans S7.9]